VKTAELLILGEDRTPLPGRADPLIGAITRLTRLVLNHPDTDPSTFALTITYSEDSDVYAVRATAAQRVLSATIN